MDSREKGGSLYYKRNAEERKGGGGGSIRNILHPFDAAAGKKESSRERNDLNYFRKKVERKPLYNVCRGSGGLRKEGILRKEKTWSPHMMKKSPQRGKREG